MWLSGRRANETEWRRWTGDGRPDRSVHPLSGRRLAAPGPRGKPVEAVRTAFPRPPRTVPFRRPREIGPRCRLGIGQLTFPRPRHAAREYRDPASGYPGLASPPARVMFHSRCPLPSPLPGAPGASNLQGRPGDGRPAVPFTASPDRLDAGDPPSATPAPQCLFPYPTSCRCAPSCARWSGAAAASGSTASSCLPARALGNRGSCRPIPAWRAASPPGRSAGRSLRSLLDEYGERAGRGSNLGGLRRSLPPARQADRRRRRPLAPGPPRRRVRP